MTAIRALTTGDPRVSPALASHLERHRGDRATPRALVAHTGLRPTIGRVRRLGVAVLDWPTRSQRGAVRNAMLASTALVERRIERDEVEQYLRDRSDAGRAAATADDA